MFIQHFIRFAVQLLKNLLFVLEAAIKQREEAKSKASEKKPEDSDRSESEEVIWTIDEVERMLVFVAKVFMLQFPLYNGPKQTGYRFEDPSTSEATQPAWASAARTSQPPAPAA